MKLNLFFFWLEFLKDETYPYFFACLQLFMENYFLQSTNHNKNKALSKKNIQTITQPVFTSSELKTETPELCV